MPAFLLVLLASIFLPPKPNRYVTDRAFVLKDPNALNATLANFERQTSDQILEVGYGLEGSLTDAKSKWITSTVIKPQFQRGDYVGGVLQGVDAMLAIRAIADPLGLVNESDESNNKKGPIIMGAPANCR